MHYQVGHQQVLVEGTVLGPVKKVCLLGKYKSGIVGMNFTALLLIRLFIFRPFLVSSPVLAHVCECVIYVCGIVLPWICKGPFTKDVRLTTGEGGLDPDVQLLFRCDSIVLSGRRGQGV